MRSPLPDGDRWFWHLDTPRCRIERLAPEHAAALSAYRNDPDVAMFQDWDTPFTQADAAGFIASMAESAPLTPGEWFQFAVVERASGALAGDVAIHRHGDDPTHLTVGYTLDKEFWGRGLATEAVRAVLDHAIALAGATHVTADALAANEPSIRLLERLGFARTGHRERVEQIDGIWHDEVTYRLDLPTRADAVGAVLVGGKSERMGRPKALVELGGVTMFEHVVAAMEAAGLPVVVAGSGPTPAHSFPVVGDAPGSVGPAAGVAAVLEARPDHDVFVAAVDQPYLIPPTIRRLLALDGAMVTPHADGLAQVTCAVYRPAIRSELGTLLERSSGPALQDLAAASASIVDEKGWNAWGEDGRSWHSLDTPAAVDDAVARFGDPGAPSQTREGT